MNIVFFAIRLLFEYCDIRFILEFKKWRITEPYFSPYSHNHYLLIVNVANTGLQ